jgi:hypothetical protein
MWYIYTYITISGGKPRDSIIVAKGLEDLAHELLRDAAHVVQTDVRQGGVVIPQFFQHLFTQIER